MYRDPVFFYESLPFEREKGFQSGLFMEFLNGKHKTKCLDHKDKKKFLVYWNETGCNQS